MSLGSAALVAGRYRLDRLIASDRSAEVWSGTDIELARPVAVKLLHANAGGEAVSQFRAAACRAASLTHEGMVRIFDYCEPESPDPPQSPFLVMEYIEGQSLADELRAGPLGAARTADIVAQVTAAMQTVHAAGLAHGDIRPEKILLSPGGAAKLFGVSGACPVGPAAISADLRALGGIARDCLGDSSSPGGDAQADRLQASVAELVAGLCAHTPAGEHDSTAVIARRAAGLCGRPSQPVAAERYSSPSADPSSSPAGFASPASTQPLRRLRRRAGRLAPAGLPAKRGSMAAVATAALIGIALASATILGAIALKPNGISQQADGAAKAAMVRVTASRLIGQPTGIVRHKLQRLGLVVRTRWRESASIAAGDVIAVRPSGLVPVHSVVVIVVSSGLSVTGTGLGHTPYRHRHRRSASNSPSSKPPTPSRSPSGSPTPAPSPSPSSTPAPSPSPTSPTSPPPSTSSSPPTSSPSSSSSAPLRS